VLGGADALVGVGYATGEADRAPVFLESGLVAIR
jgi:hypothetical protein